MPSVQLRCFHAGQRGLDGTTSMAGRWRYNGEEAVGTPAAARPRQQGGAKLVLNCPTFQAWFSRTGPLWASRVGRSAPGWPAVGHPAGAARGGGIRRCREDIWEVSARARAGRAWAAQPAWRRVVLICSALRTRLRFIPVAAGCSSELPGCPCRVALVGGTNFARCRVPSEWWHGQGDWRRIIPDARLVSDNWRAAVHWRCQRYCRPAASGGFGYGTNHAAGSNGRLQINDTVRS